MNKSSKNKIKDNFFRLLIKLNQDRLLRKKITERLRISTSVYSCCIEDNIPPELISNRSYKNAVDIFINDLSDINLKIDSHYKMLFRMENIIAANSTIDIDEFLEMHRILYKKTHYSYSGKLRDNNDTYSNETNYPVFKILPEQIEQHFQWFENRLQILGQGTPDNFFEIFHVASEISVRIIRSGTFLIGNGVMSRMLADYSMLKTGLIYNPINYADRESYLNSLKNTSYVNLTPLTEFLIKNFSRNIKEISKIVKI